MSLSDTKPKSKQTSTGYDRAEHFTQVPNPLIDATHLSMGAKFIYIVLLSYAWQKPDCFPGMETLCAAAGKSHDVVKRYIHELVDHGLVTVKRRPRGQTNLYTLSHDYAPARSHETAQATHDYAPGRDGDYAPARDGDYAPARNKGHSVEADTVEEDTEGLRGAQPAPPAHHSLSAHEDDNGTNALSLDECPIGIENGSRQAPPSTMNGHQSRSDTHQGLPPNVRPATAPPTTKKPTLKETEPAIGAARDQVLSHWHAKTELPVDGRVRKEAERVVRRHSAADIIGTIDDLWDEVDRYTGEPTKWYHSDRLTWTKIANTIPAHQRGDLPTPRSFKPRTNGQKGRNTQRPRPPTREEIEAEAAAAPPQCRHCYASLGEPHARRGGCTKSGPVLETDDLLR